MGCAESKVAPTPLLKGGSSGRTERSQTLVKGGSSQQVEEARAVVPKEKKKLVVSNITELPENVLDAMRKAEVVWDDFIEHRQILFNVLRFTHKLHVQYKPSESEDESNAVPSKKKGTADSPKKEKKQPMDPLDSPKGNLVKPSIELPDIDDDVLSPAVGRSRSSSLKQSAKPKTPRSPRTLSKTSPKLNKNAELNASSSDEEDEKDTDVGLRKEGMQELQKALDAQAAGRPPATKVLKEHSVLGKGGYGVVYKCTYRKGPHQKTKEPVAVKKMNHFTEKEVNYNFNEIGALLSFPHPNIVEYKEAHMTVSTEGQSQVWVVMEYMEGGTLAEAAHHYKFKDPEVAFVAREIMKPLEYLHSKGVAHRDLKSVNIMMTITATVKLIDFGLALNVGKNGVTQMVGSPFWMPPEMIHRTAHGLPADMWSAAVSLMELKDGKAPNRKGGRLGAMFKIGAYGIKPSKKHSENFSAFLSKCLVMDPSKRATALEMLQDPFLDEARPRSEMSTILTEVFLKKSLGA